jgi:hypothetical protein
LALDAAARLAAWTGEAAYGQALTDESNRVKAAVHRAFWDGAAGVYRSFRLGGELWHTAELTQSLALCAGVCPAPLAEGLRERLRSGDGMVEISLSHSIYKFEALLRDQRYAPEVVEAVAAQWGGMLYKGATSFWETARGAEDFDDAGSLCHGWSAVPIYLFCAHILGVRPLEPGFQRFAFRPAAVLCKAEGEIPTPYGTIRVRVGGAGERHIDYPKELIMETETTV